MEKNKTISIVKLVLRILVGCIFITSSTMKLLSIDEFELYIYSFGMFDFIFCTVISRLLIAFEFLTGIFLAAKTFYKYAWWATMLMLTGFTLFLIYVAYFRNDANCHCFGDFVELNPINSIIKNLVTIIVLLFIKKDDTDYRFRFKKLFIGLAFAAAVIVPFVVFPMDAVYTKIANSESDVNVEVFEVLKTDTTITNLNIDEGKQLMAFFMSGCKFCKLGIKKVHSIVEQNDLDKSRIKVMISGSDEGIAKFKGETETADLQYFSIHPVLSINVVYGSFPTFALIENGKVVKTMDLRGVDEKELIEWLK